MFHLELKNLLFIFVFCFFGFLAGWLTAVYIFPGGFVLNENKVLTEKKEETTKDGFVSSQENKPSFLEGMRESIMILFDPYKMGVALKKQTQFEEGGGYNFKRKPIVLKKKFPDIKFKPALKEELKDMRDTELSLSPLKESFTPKLGKKEDDILKEIQKEYDAKNRKQLELIAEEQNFFKLNGKYSFFINAFSEQEKAMEYVEEIKKSYPLWSFLIKVYSDHIRIYLGPFETKEKALEFKKNIPQPPPFNQEFLEEVSL